MGVMESRRASFDRLRMRGNLRGTTKNLMLSLSKHAQCRSPRPDGASALFGNFQHAVTLKEVAGMTE